MVEIRVWKLKLRMRESRKDLGTVSVQVEYAKHLILRSI